MDWGLAETPRLERMECVSGFTENSQQLGGRVNALDIIKVRLQDCHDHMVNC